VRIGARYRFLDGDFETGDVEIDATYEAWGAAQGDGPHVHVPQLIAQNPPPGVDLTNIDFVTPHHYGDSWSLRAGGAYNVPLGHRFNGKYQQVLTLRAGGYYDAPASDPDYTRLDFDTLAKIAGTVGAGLELPGVTFDVALAEIFDVDRTVSAGALAPVNGAMHGASVDSTGTPYPAVNNGTYSGHSHLLSFGVVVRFDELLRKH
jgi:hypothetical protein